MSDRVLGAVCVVVAAGMAWAAKDYAAPIAYEPVGPRAFPLLLSAIMALAGFWLLLRPRFMAGKLDVANLRPIGITALTVFVYAALFQVLGFPLATMLMAVPIGMAFGGTWAKSLAAGAVIGIGMFLLFDKALDVVLPTGVLAFLLGGR